MIPRVLHLTSATVPLRGTEAALSRRNAAVLTGWTVRLWSDADNDDLMASSFPGYVEQFRRLPFGVMRADVARLAYMAVHGGWYADTDYEWLRDPSDAAAPYELVLPRSLDETDEGGPRLGNAVFGSAPGHPFWAEVLGALFEQELPADLPVTAIESTTGPEFLSTQEFRAAGRTGVWLPPRACFHSQVVAARDGVFGVHHTRGSWRANPLRWRLRMMERRVRRALTTSTRS